MLITLSGSDWSQCEDVYVCARWGRVGGGWGGEEMVGLGWGWGVGGGGGGWGAAMYCMKQCLTPDRQLCFFNPV